jgi:hypothetical protein
MEAGSSSAQPSPCKQDSAHVMRRIRHENVTVHVFFSFLEGMQKLWLLTLDQEDGSLSL